LNALAAVAASLEAGVAFDVAATALTRFRGTERRFEMKGHASGITVIDDYAHHPTEIAATLQAARTRYPDRSLWAVFQPHTYSRTAAFLEGFAASLRQADQVLVTSIYAAREKDPLGISGVDLVSAIARPGAENTDEHGERREGLDQREAADVGYAETLDEAVSILAERAKPGDIVITMGAGDGHVIGERLLELLKKRRSEPTAIQHLNNSIETAPCWGRYG
jgi:UDP-N-acetylmuramate--alanine ligase